jgi:hypothetical protein
VRENLVAAGLTTDNLVTRDFFVSVLDNHTLLNREERRAHDAAIADSFATVYQRLDTDREELVSILHNVSTDIGAATEEHLTQVSNQFNERVGGLEEKMDTIISHLQSDHVPRSITTQRDPEESMADANSSEVESVTGRAAGQTTSFNTEFMQNRVGQSENVTTRNQQRETLPSLGTRGAFSPPPTTRRTNKSIKSESSRLFRGHSVRLDPVDEDDRSNLSNQSNRAPPR